MVEVGRFIVTALAVAVAIPIGGILLSLFSKPDFSIEAFFAIGAISFVMGIIGGLTIGLPTLWIARRQSWDRDIRKLGALGLVAGAMGGIALSIVFWQGNIEIVLAGIVAWTLMGAFAGFLASCVWFWLHRPDWLLEDA